MGQGKLSNMLLFMAGLNAFIGAAAARLDITYLFAGLGTGGLFYYLRYVLNSDKEGALKNMLTAASRALK